MSFVAIITGIAGGERFLDRARAETPDPKKAKPYRSERAATTDAKAHVESYPAVIQRAMKYRVEPRA